MNTVSDVTGTVWGVFAHRFALETPDGKMLADLGPEASATIVLRPGDRVTVSGESKPSEIKVSRLVAADGTTHDIVRAKKHGDEPAGDPAIALAAAQRSGYTAAGEPKRKPKHWEVRASRDGHSYDLHVTLDGTIRKVEPHPAPSAA